MNYKKIFKRFKTVTCKPGLLSAMIFAVIALSLRFYPFLFGKTLYFGDNYSLIVPSKAFSAYWLGKLILPFWNNTIFSGISWIGEINQSVLYPTTFLFFGSFLGFSLTMSIVLHLLLAFVGMYLLAKKLGVSNLFSILAGVLWMFSSQVSGSIHNISTLQTIVWIPLVLWTGLLVQKKYGPIVVSGIIFMQFLGGYPQHVVYSIFGAVLLSWFVQNRSLKSLSWWKSWISTGVLTLLLSAVIWLPFIDSFFQSTRMEQTASQAQVGSLHPLMMARMVVYPLFDSMTAGMKWGPAWSGQPNVFMYLTWFGLLVLGVRLLQIKKWKSLDWFFCMFIGLSIIFSLGQYLPGYELIQKVFPFFRVGRYPSMVLILTNVFTILWTVISLQYLKISRKASQIIFGLLFLIAFGSGVGWFMANANMESVWKFLNIITSNALEISPFHTLERDQIIIKTILSFTFGVSLLSIASIYLWYAKKRVLFVGVLTLEMIFATHTMFLYADSSVYDSQAIQDDQSELSSFLTKSPQWRSLTRNSNKPYTDYGSYWEALVVRAPFSDSFIDDNELASQEDLIRLKTGLTPDWNMVSSVPMVHGYTALLPSDYAKIWQTSDEPRINFIDQVDPESSTAASWSVKYYIVDTWFEIKESLPDWPIVYEKDTIRVYENPNALPRIRFANSSQPVDLKNFTENPNKLLFSFENNLEETEIIVADRYDKYWQAEVNGKDTGVKNHEGMRAIEIKPGHNEILLEYSPTPFFVGLVISGSTLFIVSLWIFRVSRGSELPENQKEDFSDPEA